MRCILNEVELANTRIKLSELEEMYKARESETNGDEHVRELTLWSLKKLINQLKEEIVWTEVHHPAPQR